MRICSLLYDDKSNIFENNEEIIMSLNNYKVGTFAQF